MSLVAIVIPARKGSTRFPNKPLAVIRGRTLLERTWRIAKAVKRVDQVVIATDDGEILRHAEGFGAKAVMTRPDCENGTIRVHDAVRRLKPRPSIAVNLQGDAVLTPPWVIQAVVDALRKDPRIPIATPAVRLDARRYEEFLQSKAGGRASGTLVVFGRDKNALYFSKGIIPFVRDGAADAPIYRHIGMYGYRWSALEKYVKLKPTPLERTEKLEQLRALENGIPIRVVEVDYKGRTHWSVDNPDDVGVAERIIEREGELV
jgi:3-deoxy-manno-octulosonate cytidylyltransferase (CMP-KDO synthetase)